MTYNKYQYPPWAKPVFIPPENVTLDKWEPYFPDYIYKAARSIALGQSVMPMLTDWAERNQIDKWLPRYPNQFLRARHGEQTGYTVMPQLTSWLETITLDKWEPYYPDYLWRPRFLHPATQGWFASDQGFAGNRKAQVDGWEPQFPDVFLKFKHGEQSGYSILPQMTDWTERPQLDKWKPEYPDQFLRTRHGEQGGTSYYTSPPTFAETISPDKWLPQYPNKVYKKPPIPQCESVYPLQDMAAPEVVTVDKWLPQYPSYFKARIGAPGWFDYPFGIATTEVPGLDKWSPTFPTIINRKRSLTPNDFAAPFNSTAPDAASVIGSAAAADIFFKRLLQYQGMTRPILPPVTDVVTVDKWLPEYPSYFKKKAPTPGEFAYPFGIATTETTTLDKWAQPIQLPVRRQSTTAYQTPLAFVPTVAASATIFYMFETPDDLGCYFA